MTLADAFELVESAIQAPQDERNYFVRQALQVFPDDHRARGPLEDALDADEPEGCLRTAYGQLPPSRSEVER